jgi:hypothetical protein
MEPDELDTENPFDASKTTTTLHATASDRPTLTPREQR